MVSAKSFIRAVRRNTSGAVAIIYALALPALVGFAGLSAEVGYWYVSKRDLQSAADAGAVAGALEMTYGGDKFDIHDQALAEAKRNGFSNTGGATIAVNRPPLHGAYTGDPTAVEVVLVVPRHPMFFSIFSNKDVDIGARAVGRQTPGGDACVLALSKTAHDAVKIWGSTSLNLNGCIVASNSKQSDSLSMGGSSTLNAESLWTAGNIYQGSNASVSLAHDPVEQGYPLNDPYAGTPIPTAGPSSYSYKANDISGTMTLQNAGDPANPTMITTPSTSLHLTSSDDINLEPGIYVFDNVSLKVDGGATLSCNLCSPGGLGVTLVFTGSSSSQVGSVDINGGASVTLNATASGTYSGMLFFQDPIAPNTNSSASDFNGGANIQLTGALYFPSSDVTVTGNVGGSSECTLVVSDTVQFTGSSTLETTKCSNYGYKIASSIRVTLVE